MRVPAPLIQLWVRSSLAAAVTVALPALSILVGVAAVRRRWRGSGPFGAFAEEVAKGAFDSAERAAAAILRGNDGSTGAP